ncbi:hypothetical protein BKA93DRAFT_725335 [Sparassis latifolia]
MRHEALHYVTPVPAQAGCDPIPRLEELDHPKHDRGWAQHLMARLLCPRSMLAEFDRDRNAFCRDVEEGIIPIDSCEWPSFLYPEDGYDPDNIDTNLLRSPFLVACFRHIFTGCRSGKKTTPGPASGRKSITDIYSMTKITPRNIAYICVLVRFALNSQTHWSERDGEFDTVEFFQNIIGLFDEPEDSRKWSDSTLKWWNEYVFISMQRRV